MWEDGELVWHDPRGREPPCRDRRVRPRRRALRPRREGHRHARRPRRQRGRLARAPAAVAPDALPLRAQLDGARRRHLHAARPRRATDVHAPRRRQRLPLKEVVETTSRASRWSAGRIDPAHRGGVARLRRRAQPCHPPLGAVVAALAWATAAAPAPAATLTLKSAVDTTFDEGERVLFQRVDIAVDAAPGEQNALTLTTTADEVRLADVGAPAHGGQGLRAGRSPTGARCPVVRTTRRDRRVQARRGRRAGRRRGPLDVAGARRRRVGRRWQAVDRRARRAGRRRRRGARTGPPAAVVATTVSWRAPATGAPGDDTIVARTAEGEEGDDVLTGNALGRRAGQRHADRWPGGRHPAARSRRRRGRRRWRRRRLDYPNHPHGLWIDLSQHAGRRVGGRRARLDRERRARHRHQPRRRHRGRARRRTPRRRVRPRPHLRQGGRRQLGSEDPRAELHGGSGDDFLVRLRGRSDCGPGTDTFAAPGAPLRLGRVRASCERASPNLENQLDTVDPSIVVDSVRVRRGRLEITFVSGATSTERIDVELLERGRRLAFVKDVTLRGGVGRRTSFRVPLTALGRRTFAAGDHVRAALYLDADAPLGSQIVQIDR